MTDARQKTTKNFCAKRGLEELILYNSDSPKCWYCGKQFTRTANKNKHEDIKHEDLKN